MSISELMKVVNKNQIVKIYVTKDGKKSLISHDFADSWKETPKALLKGTDIVNTIYSDEDALIIEIIK